MLLRARELWLALAALVALQNLLVLHTTQDSPTLVVFALLLWGGALICLEDQLPTLDPSPGRTGLLVGGVLLVAVLFRAGRILHYDAVVYPLTVLAGLSLALLCVPLRQLGRFRDPLLILLLMPLNKLLEVIAPVPSLSRATALASGVLLQALGFEASVDGPQVLLPGGSVSVWGACTGIDMILQVSAIAVIFLLAFPLQGWPQRMLMLAAAPLIGFVSNVGRIALLAVIHAEGGTGGRWWFAFFHDSNGSLVFAAVGVSVFALLYLRVLERQLSPGPHD